MTPTTPATKRVENGGDGVELSVGDAVDVPGGMYGSVRFIGSVKGKKGVFAGVELGREWAARGKNDGDVDGYVTASHFGDAAIYQMLVVFLIYYAHRILESDISRLPSLVLVFFFHSTVPRSVPLPYPRLRLA